MDTIWKMARYYVVHLVGSVIRKLWYRWAHNPHARERFTVSEFGVALYGILKTKDVSVNDLIEKSYLEFGCNLCPVLREERLASLEDVIAIERALDLHEYETDELGGAAYADTRSRLLLSVQSMGLFSGLHNSGSP